MTASTRPTNRQRDLRPVDELAALRRRLGRLVLDRHGASLADEEAYAALAEREMELLLRRRR